MEPCCKMGPGCIFIFQKRWITDNTWANTVNFAVIHLNLFVCVLRGGNDKSLARPTSWCWTESIVSLERGVCTCAKLWVFSCYRGWRGWKEACQATRAISTTWRRELLPSFFFPARQGTKGNSCHSDRNRTWTIVFHHQKLGGPV